MNKVQTKVIDSELRNTRYYYILIVGYCYSSEGGIEYKEMGKELKTIQEAVQYYEELKKKDECIETCKINEVCKKTYSKRIEESEVISTINYEALNINN